MTIYCAFMSGSCARRMVRGVSTHARACTRTKTIYRRNSLARVVTAPESSFFLVPRTGLLRSGIYGR